MFELQRLFFVDDICYQLERDARAAATRKVKRDRRPVPIEFITLPMPKERRVLDVVRLSPLA